MYRQESDISKYIVPDTNLAKYLARVQRGNAEIYRTTFYKGKSQETVLSNWEKRLNVIGSRYPSLLSFEIDLRNKVGPMSFMQPLDKRLDDVRSYYESIEREAQPIDSAAISACLNEWGAIAADAVTLRSQADTVLHMPLSTSSGTPFFTRKRTVVDQTVPLRIEKDQFGYLMRMPSVEKYAAAIIGWRGQEGGPGDTDTKQRVVWMFPFGVNVLEQQMYQPLLASFQKHGAVPAWLGNEYVDAAVTRLFDTKAPEDLVICTDFTKFDQHFNPTLSSTGQRLIEQLVKKDTGNAGWLNEVFPIKYDIPMILKMDAIWTGDHGMGSGSGGTNFDETLVHRSLQHEAACMQGEELNPNSQCLGDDGILTYPNCTVDDVVRHYTSHGLDMNPDKQYAANDHCVYLRRWHHADYRISGQCVGVYSTYRALGRLMYQERYYDPEHWGPKMVALRQLSILENVKWHPLREEFADYCMRGDKYRLGIDIPGFLANIQREAEKAIDYMPDFLGYNRSVMEDTAISHWWIVQYLKSKA